MRPRAGKDNGEEKGEVGKHDELDLAVVPPVGVGPHVDGPENGLFRPGFVAEFLHHGGDAVPVRRRFCGFNT